MRLDAYNRHCGNARLLIPLVAGLMMTFLSTFLFYPYGDFRMAGAPFRFLMMSESMVTGSVLDNIHVNWKLLSLSWAFYSSLSWAILFVFSFASFSMKRNVLLAVIAGTLLSTLTLAIYRPVYVPKYRQKALEERGIPFAFLFVGGEYSAVEKTFLYRFSTDLFRLAADVGVWGSLSIAVLAAIIRRKRLQSHRDRTRGIQNL